MLKHVCTKSSAPSEVVEAGKVWREFVGDDTTLENWSNVIQDHFTMRSRWRGLSLKYHPDHNTESHTLFSIALKVREWILHLQKFHQDWTVPCFGLFYRRCSPQSKVYDELWEALKRQSNTCSWVSIHDLFPPQSTDLLIQMCQFSTLVWNKNYCIRPSIWVRQVGTVWQFSVQNPQSFITLPDDVDSHRVPFGK